MAENFRPLSDVPECSDLELQKNKLQGNTSKFSKFELGEFKDISDPDVQGEIQRIEEACKDSSIGRLHLLQEISDNNFGNNIINSTHRIESQKISGNIIHIVKKGETLGEIIKNTYGLMKWSEISKKLGEVYKSNPGLTENIKEGDKINLIIEDTDTYIKRESQKSYEEKSTYLLELDKQREKKISDLNNEKGKTAIITANYIESKNKLDNNKFSGELNNDAFEIFKNMKNTKGEQIIGTYRNKDWEVKNILLGDNRGKNIYMELDDSFTWDDIDSGVIDNITTQEELEKVMIDLLKRYEKENREDV